MAEEPDVIREQIEETRSALTDKLETLEGQVRETVQSAKETVEGTIENVKSSVHETVESVRQTFDLKYQVERHPWAMLGGSFVAGFALGHWLPEPRPQRSRYTEGRYAYSGQDAELARAPMGFESHSGYRPNGSPSGTAPVQTAPAQPSLLSWFQHTFANEIEKVKEVAIGAAMGVVRDLAKQSLPKLAPQIEEVMDSATAKLGGQPVAGPIVQPVEGMAGQRY